MLHDEERAHVDKAENVRRVEMAWITPFRRYAPALLVVCVAGLLSVAFWAAPIERAAFRNVQVFTALLAVIYTALAALVAHLCVEARRQDTIAKRERADAENLYGLSERLATTLESIGEGVITTDRDGMITYANGVAAHLTGWPVSRALGAPIRKVVRIMPENSRKAIEHPLARVLEGGERVREDDAVVLLDPNGKKSHLIAYHGEPIIDREGWLAGGVLVLRDVTHLRAVQRHRKQLIEELSQANERLRREVAHREEGRRAALNIMQDAQLAQAALRKSEANLRETNAALEEYARVASHDLQEPLRKIESFAQVLVEDYGDRFDEQGREYLDIMVRSTRRMRQLIRDILAFSRAGTSERPFVPVDLNNVLAIVKDHLSERIQERNARIVTGRLPIIHGDQTQMIQLFQNLIGNALKFNDKPHPRVDISAEDLDSAWKIIIRDNGIGMFTNESDAIFAPFKRLHSQRGYEGTGIGLAICRRIVTRHGGTIGADSTLKKGSTFWLTLPKTPDEHHGRKSGGSKAPAKTKGDAQ